MSARARFWLPLLWVVKMSGFFVEGRGRPLVVGVGVEVEVEVEVVEARRVERVVVKAELVVGVMEGGLRVRERGGP